MSLTLDRKGGLPKKTQTCFFFQIDKARVHEFRTQLAQLVPMITSTAQVLSHRHNIAQNKKETAAKKSFRRSSTSMESIYHSPKRG